MVFQKINVDSTLLDVDFHPKQPLICAADIGGEVHIFPLREKSDGSASSSGEDSTVTTFSHHRKSCRRACFSQDGNLLFSISKDKSLHVVDLNEGKTKHKLTEHNKGLYSMLALNENIVATGDEDGALKVWDLRQEKCFMERKDCEEFISDMVCDDRQKIVAASSGDGTVTAFDVRKHKMVLQSELFDSELLSLCKVKRGSKLCVGSGEGVVYLFNWGEWGNMSDRFPGHPDSIDSMITASDDVIVTGGADGKIRVCSVFPNRIVREVGGHEEFPIEGLSLSPDASQIASCSHDSYIRFWSVSDSVDEAESLDPQSKPAKKSKRATNDFYQGLVDSESEDDSD